MNEQADRQNRAWIVAWRENAEVLDRVRMEELRALSEEDSGKWFSEMAVDTETIWISPARAMAEGMIEQQRIFMLSHEHPARHRRRS